ncbi:MAG TPA: hypothetical protein VF772_17570 [Terriglobales bacterium]
MYPHVRFIQSYVDNGRVGVLVEFGLETWVITERREFLDLSSGLAMHIAALDPDSLGALLRQDYLKEPTITVEKVLAAGSALMGERISVTRFVRRTNEPPMRLTRRPFTHPLQRLLNRTPCSFRVRRRSGAQVHPHIQPNPYCDLCELQTYCIASSAAVA